MKGLKSIAVGALAAILMVGGAKAAAATDYASVKFDIGGAPTVSKSAAQNITQAISGTLTANADNKLEAKMTYTFPATTKSATVDGKDVSLTDDARDYILTDYFTADDFKAAVIDGKTTYERSYKVEINTEDEHLSQTVKLTMVLGAKAPTIQAADGGDDIWNKNSLTNVTANYRKVTVTVKPENTLLSTLDGETISFYVKTNSMLTEDILNSKVASYLAEHEVSVVGYYTEIKALGTEDKAFVDPTEVTEDIDKLYMYVNLATTVDPEKEPAEEPAEENPSDNGEIIAPETQGAQTDKNTEDVKSPNTGDNFGTLVSMVSASAAGLFVTIKKTILG